jgi:hypothetical protein
VRLVLESQQFNATLRTIGPTAPDRRHVPSLARNLGLQHSDVRVIEADTPVYVSGV